MATVTMQGLTKHFGGKPATTAVDGLDLEISEGEFLVLLGPSGCGKTTTLRCLAGLETPDEGSVSFGGRSVFDASRRVNVPPDKRNVGMVFQSYALWPHMTVRKNISYPLRARRTRRDIARQWVAETASLVECENLLDRYPGQLSGGQQQRVALARGLVARPDLMLFDEPLSNLDARLREQVRTQIHELHERLEFTAVFVTHDQSEALALGDRLAIMRDGRVEQLDGPERIFEEPASEYVAEFIGMSNRLRLRRAPDGTWTLDGAAVTGAAPSIPREHDEVVVRARPDTIHLAPSGEPVDETSTCVAGTVIDTEYGGRHMDIVVSAGGTRVHARVPTGEPGSWARTVGVGAEVAVCFRSLDVSFYDTAGRRVAAVPSRGRAMVGA